MIGMDISNDHEFVEFDPTGRYGRYNEILGKGASKIVYRAFDEYEGIEVAWNQVKLNDFLQSPQELERLYCEIHLLKTLKHKHIMKFYTSWVDISKRNINFVTELFTSGTLRQYRQKHKRVHIRAVKHWCRQILKGLLYLHSCDPPIIHRDLKCDNIFINGNEGVVKIGDLGLAAILRKSYAEHCVGTPEFMAPEVYEEEYNELVDVYSFGMCVLEMVTCEYPYSECTHPAQIYMKVMRGTKPEALSKVKDPEVRQFVEKCLATASQRLPARELLMDPFLQIDSHGSGSWEGDRSQTCQILRQPSYTLYSDSSGDQMHETRTENGWGYNDAETSFVQRHPSSELLHSVVSVPSNGFIHEDDWDCYTPSGTRGINLFSSEDESSDNVDIAIKGTRGEDGSIFMRLTIPDEEGHIQNIYFPFDVENDTAIDVANEMVGELDITDYEVGIIAEMIDGEVASLAPEWKSEQKIEVPGSPSTDLCNNHASNFSIDASACIDPQSTQNTGLNASAAIHDQFEEGTYDAVGSEQPLNNEAQVPSLAINLSSPLSRKCHSENELSKFNKLGNNEKEIHMDSEAQSKTRELVDQSDSSSINNQSSQAVKLKFPCPPPIKSGEVQHELKRLSSRRQFEVKDYRNQRLGEKLLSPRPYLGSAVPSPRTAFKESSENFKRSAVPSPRTAFKESSENFKRSLNFGKRFSFHIPPRRNLLQPSNSFAEQTRNSHCSGSNSGTPTSQHSKESPAENMFTAKSFYVAHNRTSFLPRARSLPQSAQGRDMRIDSCKVTSVVNPVQEEIPSS